MVDSFGLKRFSLLLEPIFLVTELFYSGRATFLAFVVSEIRFDCKESTDFSTFHRCME